LENRRLHPVDTALFYPFPDGPFWPGFVFFPDDFQVLEELQGYF
jgi:hypothetical protein